MQFVFSDLLACFIIYLQLSSHCHLSSSNQVAASLGSTQKKRVSPELENNSEEEVEEEEEAEEAKKRWVVAKVTKTRRLTKMRRYMKMTLKSLLMHSKMSQFPLPLVT